MSCLFIYSDERKLEDFASFMNETFGNMKYFTYNTNDISVEKVSLLLKDVTMCVISPGERTHIVSFLVGYILGNGFPIYTANDGFRESHKTLKLIYNFKTVSAMYDYLRRHKIDIHNQETKRVASSNLYKLGIPFTADNFAQFIKKSNVDICEYFLKAGMSPNSRDVNGTPMLNIACREDKVDMVKWLLSHKATIDIVSTDREYTPLMDAVWRGNIEAAKILIDKGADVNKISKEGQTMIVLAVGAGNVAMSKLLAENGADVDIADSMGMSAYGYATLFKKQEIVAILEKYHKEE